MALDFMRTIQNLAPGRVLPSFKVSNQSKQSKQVQIEYCVNVFTSI